VQAQFSKRLFSLSAGTIINSFNNMNFFNILEILILFVLFIWFVFFIIQAYNIVFRGYAPFVSTKRKHLKNIFDNANIKDGQTIYELGCGRAGFLQFARKNFPASKLVGFEYAFFPYFIAKIQNWIKKSNLDIKKKNIFKIDLSEADTVYCYLNEDMMKKLKPKFLSELKPGSQVISLEFKIPDMEAEKIINKKIYLYKF